VFGCSEGAIKLSVRPMLLDDSRCSCCESPDVLCICLRVEYGVEMYQQLDVQKLSKILVRDCGDPGFEIWVREIRGAVNEHIDIDNHDKDRRYNHPRLQRVSPSI
jgi:hypothetical protein